VAFTICFERGRLVYRCGLHSGGICRSRDQSYRTIAAGPAREYQREIKVSSITISETDLDCGLLLACASGSPHDGTPGVSSVDREVVSLGR
jgi:hypothetical protein